MRARERERERERERQRQRQRLLCGARGRAPPTTTRALEGASRCMRVGSRRVGVRVRVEPHTPLPTQILPTRSPGADTVPCRFGRGRFEAPQRAHRDRLR